MTNAVPKPSARDAQPRILPDDTLLVFLSDTHIGGDGGRDIFEAPEDLVALFADVDRHPGPVELVLAGDFFDLLRIADVPAGRNRAALTIARPEYAALFASLREFAAGPGRRLTYLPGNHDAEVWWNADVRAELERAGLVHEFALGYAAAFASAPDRVIACQHGNAFDPANLIEDYDDRLDTPLGHHVVTDVLSGIPRGSTIAALHLRDVDRIFPLTTIPEWVAGRLFYDFVTFVLRWLVLPLAGAYVLYEFVVWRLGANNDVLDPLLVELAYDLWIIFLGFVVLISVARRLAQRIIRERARRPNATVAAIRERLESGALGRPAVFVSGHTHAPSLTSFGGGVQVNSGCWLRQLHPVGARARMPAVFVSEVVQTHVRVRRSAEGIEIELWELPRPFTQSLLGLERLAIAGRIPRAPAADAPPRIIARATA